MKGMQYYKSERVWIGIGSNLLDPKKQVQRALYALDQLPMTKLIVCSSYYRSRPLGKIDQPDFLNMVVVLDTILYPEELLGHLQFIEKNQGRVRNTGFFRSGPRTLDLDILLFGKYIINSDQLMIPHYDMLNREFVVYPLFELDQYLVLPNGIAIMDIIKILPRNNLSFWKV